MGHAMAKGGSSHRTVLRLASTPVAAAPRTWYWAQKRCQANGTPLTSSAEVGFKEPNLNESDSELGQLGHSSTTEDSVTVKGKDPAPGRLAYYLKSTS